MNNCVFVVFFFFFFFFFFYAGLEPDILFKVDFLSLIYLDRLDFFLCSEGNQQGYMKITYFYI